jgi:uncharacterized C2H2 Zn-finger protein
MLNAISQLTFPQRHQAEQTIPCPGCKEVFPRAGDMIAHIENGECNVITEWDFYAHVQHKFVKNEIMKDLGEISENLQINPAFAVPKINPGLIEDDDTLESIENKTDGGVLLDDENEEQKGGDEFLEAQLASLKLDGKKVPLTRSNLEVWPRLPNQPKSGLAGQALTRTIGSPPPSIVDSDIPASQFASQITSRRGGLKIHTESYPSLQGSRVVSESSQGGFDDGDGVSSAGTAKAESVLMRPAAWTTDQTPRALFGDVKPVPQSAVTKSILKKRDEEQSKAPNLLINVRWWDPMSEDYTAHLFLDTVEHKYRCPFPACDRAEFEHVKGLEEHLLGVHAKVQFRCPGCFKIFRKAQGMMSHMESTMKCPVKKSKYFKSVCIVCAVIFPLLERIDRKLTDVFPGCRRHHWRYHESQAPAATCGLQNQYCCGQIWPGAQRRHVDQVQG